jgi:hypothetical protein
VTKTDEAWDATVRDAERDGDVELAFKAREIAAGLTALQREALPRFRLAPTHDAPCNGNVARGLERKGLVTHVPHDGLSGYSIGWAPTPLGRAVAAILEESKP